jgi:hypothetical protein
MGNAIVRQTQTGAVLDSFMKRSGQKPAFLAALLAVVVLGWPVHNEVVSTAALESELETAAAGCAPANSCSTGADEILTHWISRTSNGNLFLVMQTRCQAAEHCAASFVERTARGTATRLNVEGQFRVILGNKPIPDVQTWRALSDTETEYTRYTWTTGAYVKAETRTAYRVDGVECGSALECYQLANKAHAEHNTGRALKIWETVHKVSWI